jgi:hypothetical protein
MNEEQTTPPTPEQQAAADRFAKISKAINLTAFPDVKGHWFRSGWLYRFTNWVNDRNPFARYQYVASAEEYIKLPWKKRSVWGFWYVEPLITGGQHILGSKKDRKAVEDFIKQNHAVQYFIRWHGFRLRCKLNRFYDWFRETINPRQKWLTKQVPKSWCDKSHLIKDINFACIVDFIEGEKALNVVNWEASSDQADKFSKELVQCYNWIKQERPALEKQRDNSYPDEETTTGDFFTDYTELNRLEALLDAGDTKWLVWIVTNRDFLWT